MSKAHKVQSMAINMDKAVNMIMVQRQKINQNIEKLKKIMV